MTTPARTVDLLNRDSVRRLFPVVFLVVLYIVPQVFGKSSYRLGEYELVLSFVLIGVALNIAMAYAGQFVIGITAVFAVGAYAAVLVAKHHPGNVGLIPMLVIGAAVGAIGGMVVGLPALRVGGFYLALVSLYAALAIPSVAEQTNSLGGDTGIPLYAVLGFAPKISGEKLYLIVLTLVLLASLFSWALLHGRVGRRFLALSSSDQLSVSLGIAGYRTKLLALFISSVLAGAAGGIYVYTQQFFAPDSSTASLAILILAGLVIGGAGTTFGPLIGGLLVLGLNQFFTSFASYNGIIFGGLLMAFAVFLPSGLVDRLSALAVKMGLKAASSSTTGLHQSESLGAVPEWPAWTPVIGGGTDSPLQIAGVRKTFGGVTAVDDVNLSVERGTIHGLIGSNGSGKTTLLNLISGFYRLDAGEISIGDVKVNNLPSYEVARAGIARTFQSPKLMLDESAIDNVVAAVELRVRCSGLGSTFRSPKGIRTNRTAYDESREALESMGLGGILEEPAGTLPHGTRRLVELARAIAVRPSFVLLDEPAAGLSPAELDLLVAAIQQLAGSGVGVLLIEHNVPMVLDIAKEVTVLHQGKRLFQGPPAELRQNEEVASAFLGIDVEPAS